MKKYITMIAVATALLLSVSSCQTKHCLSQQEAAPVELSSYDA